MPPSDASNSDPTASSSEYSPFETTAGESKTAERGEQDADGDQPSSTERKSKVTVGVHFATNRRGQLRARLRRTREGTDETDLSELMEGFAADDVVVRGRIQTLLDLNALFAEGLFADRSLDEHEFQTRAVESVNRLQREDATPLRDGTPIGEDDVYDLGTDPSDEPPPDAVRVAIPFITDHSGAVCARLDLDASLRDTTKIDTLEDAFTSGKALVRGKIRADVNLNALFDARIVEGVVDPGTMYMPPTS